MELFFATFTEKLWRQQFISPSPGRLSGFWQHRPLQQNWEGETVSPIFLLSKLDAVVECVYCKLSVPLQKLCDLHCQCLTS